MLDCKENYKFYLGVKGLNKLQTTTQASESWCFGINFLKKLCVQKSRVFLFPTFFFYRFQFSFVYFLDRSFLTFSCEIMRGKLARWRPKLMLRTCLMCLVSSRDALSSRVSRLRDV